MLSHLTRLLQAARPARAPSCRALCSATPSRSVQLHHHRLRAATVACAATSSRCCLSTAATAAGGRLPEKLWGLGRLNHVAIAVPKDDLGMCECAFLPSCPRACVHVRLCVISCLSYVLRLFCAAWCCCQWMSTYVCICCAKCQPPPPFSPFFLSHLPCSSPSLLTLPLMPVCFCRGKNQPVSGRPGWACERRRGSTRPRRDHRLRGPRQHKTGSEGARHSPLSLPLSGLS